MNPTARLWYTRKADRSRVAVAATRLTERFCSRRFDRF
jgi:hypothetical protein